MAKKKLPIVHIGNWISICNKSISANLREDLGFDRYKRMGNKDLFRDQKPYRICKNCLRKVWKQDKKTYKKVNRTYKYVYKPYPKFLQPQLTNDK